MYAYVLGLQLRKLLHSRVTVRQNAYWCWVAIGISKLYNSRARYMNCNQDVALLYINRTYFFPIAGFNYKL